MGAFLRRYNQLYIQKFQRGDFVLLQAILACILFNCLHFMSASRCTHTFCLPVLQWQLRVALECIYNGSAERLPALNRHLHALERVQEQREESRCKDGRKDATKLVAVLSGGRWSV